MFMSILALKYIHRMYHDSNIMEYIMKNWKGASHIVYISLKTIQTEIISNFSIPFISTFKLLSITNLNVWIHVFVKLKKENGLFSCDLLSLYFFCKILLTFLSWLLIRTGKLYNYIVLRVSKLEKNLFIQIT